jgi:spore coat polysaccharide biosynthesis protein SpsF
MMALSTTPFIQVIVQARMSSRRFPGKVLAPLHGRPVIIHVVEAVTRALPGAPLVVATTTDEADDPLVAYLDSLGVRTFRGDRDDVLARFRGCLAKYPAEWFVRICADSPYVDADTVRAVAAGAGPDVDVVSTRLPHPRPTGQNAELVRVAAFAAVDPADCTAHDREHVTPYFYRHPERFRIAGVGAIAASPAGAGFAVDEVSDLRRLESSAPPSGHA